MEYVLNFLEMPELAYRRVGGFFAAGARHIKDHFVPHARNNYHPHILGDRALALFSTALVCVKVLSIALLTFGPVLPAYSSAITVDNIISLTNESRAQYGLAQLSQNAELDSAAQAKANDMLVKGYFAHTTPDGRTPWDFISAVGYNYIMAGENLAVNFTEAENVEQAWMNSPGHKANILNKNFEQIGIGISEGQYQGHTAVFVVQMFGTPAEQKISLSSAPTPVQTAPVPAPSAVASNPASSAPANIKLEVIQAQTQMHNDQLLIQAQVAGAPVKVLAYFGDRAIMLAPQADGSWAGQADLAELAAGQQNVRVWATDIRGTSSEMQLADFTNSTVNNFEVLGTSTNASVKVSWLGQVFDPKSMEKQVYLFFIAGILASMILAIAVKRHIQHINLIANGSLVAIFACLLWMAG